MERVDINNLSLQQLGQIRGQLEKEVEHLSESFVQLRQAQTKFQDCAASVKDASVKGNDGRELFVPLSATLYVPGKMVNTDKYLVDIGTDYYVEKNAKETEAFFNNKVETLNKNLVDLDKLVNEKMGSFRAVEEMFKSKLVEAQKEEKANKATAAS